MSNLDSFYEWMSTIDAHMLGHQLKGVICEYWFLYLPRPNMCGVPYMYRSLNTASETYWYLYSGFCWIGSLAVHTGFAWQRCEFFCHAIRAVSARRGQI